MLPVVRWRLRLERAWLANLAVSHWPVLTRVLAVVRLLWARGPSLAAIPVLWHSLRVPPRAVLLVQRLWLSVPAVLAPAARLVSPAVLAAVVSVATCLWRLGQVLLVARWCCRPLRTAAMSPWKAAVS